MDIYTDFKKFKAKIKCCYLVVEANRRVIIWSLKIVIIYAIVTLYMAY